MLNDDESAAHLEVDILRGLDTVAYADAEVPEDEDVHMGARRRRAVEAAPQAVPSLPDVTPSPLAAASRHQRFETSAPLSSAIAAAASRMVILEGVDRLVRPAHLLDIAGTLLGADRMRNRPIARIVRGVASVERPGAPTRKVPTLNVTLHCLHVRDAVTLRECLDGAVVNGNRIRAHFG
jgi:hypothetical protein